jgi:hypothetical protein
MAPTFGRFLALRESLHFDTPTDVAFMRRWFEDRYDPVALLVYADWVEENKPSVRDASGPKVDATRLASDLRRCANRQWGWSGEFSLQSFLAHGPARKWQENEHALKSSVFYTEQPKDGRDGRRQVRILPGMRSLRLSAGTGQWFLFRNADPERTARLATGIDPAVASDWELRHFYHIALRDYRPASAAEVPDELVRRAFWERLMKFMSKRR